MLNVYQLNQDPTKLVVLKPAYIKDDSGNLIPFKYYRVLHDELERTDWFMGIDTQENTVTIRTYFNYDFNIHTKIVIGNRQYAVKNVYTEIPEHTNGLYRDGVRKLTYIVLTK